VVVRSSSFKERVLRARRGVVLAAGAEATALLLFRSGFTRGVGRRYRDHPTRAWTTLAWRKPPASASTYSGVLFEGEYQISYCGHRTLAGVARFAAGAAGLPFFLRVTASCVATLFDVLPSWLQEWCPVTVGTMMATVSSPEAEATLRYDADHDRLVVDDLKPLSSRDRAVLDAATRRARAIADAMGLTHRCFFPLLGRFVGTLWHPAGGAPRGLALDARTLAVLDAPNLFVAGVAAMPRLPVANPMCSCYAIGWRLAELLLSSEEAAVFQ